LFQVEDLGPADSLRLMIAPEWTRLVLWVFLTVTANATKGRFIHLVDIWKFVDVS